MVTVNKVLGNSKRIFLLHSDAVHTEKGFHLHSLDIFGAGGHFVWSSHLHITARGLFLNLPCSEVRLGSSSGFELWSCD